MKPASSLMIFLLNFYLFNISLSVDPEFKHTRTASSVGLSKYLDSGTIEETPSNVTESLYDSVYTNSSETADSTTEIPFRVSNTSEIPGDILAKVTVSALSNTKSTSYSQIVTDSKILESDTKSMLSSAFQPKKLDRFIDSTVSTASYPRKSSSLSIIKVNPASSTQSMNKQDLLLTLEMSKIENQNVPLSISKVSSDENSKKKGHLFNDFSTKQYGLRFKKLLVDERLQKVGATSTYTQAPSSSSTRSSTYRTEFSANMVKLSDKIAITTMKPFELINNLTSGQEKTSQNTRKTTVSSLTSTEDIEGEMKIPLSINVDLLDEVSIQKDPQLSRLSTKQYELHLEKALINKLLQNVGSTSTSTTYSSITSTQAPSSSSTRSSAQRTEFPANMDKFSDKIAITTMKPLELIHNLPSGQKKTSEKPRKITVSSLASTQDFGDEMKIPLSISVYLFDEVSTQKDPQLNRLSTKQYGLHLEKALIHKTNKTSTTYSSSTSPQEHSSSSTRSSTQRTEFPANMDKALNQISVTTIKTMGLRSSNERININTLIWKIFQKQKTTVKYKLRKKPHHVSTQTATQLTTLLTTTQPAQWRIRDSSITSDSFEQVCKLDRDVGFGSDSYSSWYYNYKNGRCEWFSYLGSVGNGNRFNNRANCEHSCIEKYENICQRIDIVYCEEKWLRCKMEMDIECQKIAKNENRNELHFCPPKQPLCVRNNIRRPPIYLTHRSLIPSNCLLPPDSGNCRTDSNSLLVYHYDSRLNDCLGILYSNCGGNSNRFPSKSECMNRCAI